MNDKKNINRLSLFASQICNGVLEIIRTKKDMNRMDIPKNPSDFFFVTIFRKAPAFKQRWEYVKDYEATIR